MLRKTLDQPERSEIRALPYVTQDLRTKNREREAEKNQACAPHVTPTPPNWRSIIGMLFVLYFNVLIFSLR